MKKYLDRISDLESQLVTANAKIVELEKHDCEKFIDEGMGCSICSNLHLDLNKAKEIQDHVNWRISRLESELSTANKKAEKLVEHIKRWNSIYHLGIKCQDHIEDCEYCQALKELRGEK